VILGIVIGLSGGFVIGLIVGGHLAVRR